MDLTAWLRRLGLEEYARAFQKNAIDAETLPTLTAEDLKELGVIPVGHRRKLLTAIAQFSDSSSSEPSSTETTPVPTIDQPVQTHAERRQLTVMFCDLVGSTALSVRLDPEEMREVIRAYQNCVAEVVNQSDGFVAKYMGDGVLIYFGYPAANEDQASRAVAAGLALVEAVGRVECQPGIGPLSIRIGIATGLVVVGDLIGKGSAREQTVVGETPNLAARLQTCAPPNAIVISSATRRLIGGEFDLEELGPQILNGFAEPVATWRVLGRNSVESRFEAHVTGLVPMVGREHELALLIARWHQARDGEGQVVLVSGQPGIGKSRIIRAVIEQVECDPHIRVRNQCSPHYINTAFHPITAQLERAAYFMRDDSASTRLDKLEVLLAQGTAHVSEVAPLIATLLSIPVEGRYPPLTYSPQRQKELIIKALVDQLLGLAQKQPVLSIFEDVHWADPTTLEVLDQIINRLDSARVLLLVTFRPEFVPPWKSRSQITTHALTRLGRRQSAALVMKVTGGKVLPPEVLDQIVAKTDGIPLFVEELTKTVLEAGFLHEEADCYVLARPLPPLAIPSTLQDSLMARLDRLVPVKEVAQLGAVIGRDFSYELLASVSSLLEPDLQAALAQLVSSELVFVRGTLPQANYSFKHALVQDTAYASLLKSQRQLLHVRIAEALEERWPETMETQPEVLAQHFTSAGMETRAIPYWIRAGQRAQERAALESAVKHLKRALELVGPLPASVERDRLELAARVALGTTFMIFIGPPSLDVRRALEPALQLCVRLNDADIEQRIRVVWGLTLHHAVRGEYPEALEMAAELITLGNDDAGSYAKLLGYSLRSFVHHCKGEHETAKHDVNRILSLYEPGRHDFLVNLLNFHPKALVQVFRAHSLWMMGYPDQAVKVAEETLEEATRLGHIFNTAWVSIMFSVVFMFRREPEQQIALLEKGRVLAKNFGIDFLSDFLIWWGADSYYQLGNYERAAELAKMGSEFYPAMGGQHTVPYMKAVLARTLARMGNLEVATTKIEEALRDAVKTGEREHEPEVFRIKGEILIQKGQFAAAESAFLQSLEIARIQKAKGWELRTALSLADFWRTRGRIQEASELLAPIYAWFTEGLDTPDLQDAKSLLDALSTSICQSALNIDPVSASKSDPLFGVIGGAPGGDA